MIESVHMIFFFFFGDRVKESMKVGCIVKHENRSSSSLSENKLGSGICIDQDQPPR